MTDRQMLRYTLSVLRDLPCTFWACEGSNKNKVQDMLTCTKCWAEYETRQHLKNVSARGRKKPRGEAER